MNYKNAINYKKIINIHSKVFKNHKKSVSSGLSIIQLAILFAGFSVFVFLTNFTFKTFGGLILWNSLFIGVAYDKHKKQTLFPKYTNNSAIMLNQKSLNSYSKGEISKILIEAKKQLDQNKKAVKTALKVTKYLFMIIIVGTYEDNIKSLFNLGNLTNQLVVIFLLGMISILLLMCSYPLSVLINLLNVGKIKLDNYTNTLINNGMFVHNYVILTVTISELSYYLEIKSEAQDHASQN